MAASAQVALVIAQCIKVLGSSRVPVHRSYMCMTDNARDKDEVTKDKMTICLI